MQYDFTTVIDRHGKDSIAMDMIGCSGTNAPGAPKAGFDPIPMWVADMSFPVLPAITQAMQQRLSHPVFGYFMPSEEYYDAIIRWQQTRNGVQDLRPEHIGYENGVLGGVVSAMGVFCSAGDKILVHSPTYVGFTGSLENAGYKLIHSPLKQDAEGVWRMDFADMEEKLKSHKIHAAVFCSPHNPTGRVWERWEVEQAMELFKKYDVSVVSDEIWSDIVLDSHQHIPTQSVSRDARNRTVALYAPSKTFNLAGLVGSYHIIYNQGLRHRHDKQSSLSHYNSMNVLSMHALLGAYGPEGHAWVEQLRHVITGNVDYACRFIESNFSGIRVSRPQGTYMLFLDCEQWCKTNGKDVSQLLQAGWDVGVGWQDGRPFHGANHIRMNLALPLSRLQEAMERLQKFVFSR